MTFLGNLIKCWRVNGDPDDLQFGLVLGLILLLLLGLVSVAITRRLSAAFKEGVDFAHSIAAGNLDASIESSADDFLFRNTSITFNIDKFKVPYCV